MLAKAHKTYLTLDYTKKACTENCLWVDNNLPIFSIQINICFNQVLYGNGKFNGLEICTKYIFNHTTNSRREFFIAILIVWKVYSKSLKGKKFSPKIRYLVWKWIIMSERIVLILGENNNLLQENIILLLDKTIFLSK